MILNTLFASILQYIITFLFFIPIQILRLIGLLLPSCDQLGVVMFTNDAINGAIQWIRFAWPILQFLPWDVIWGLVSAEILLLVFLYFLDHLPMLFAFVGRWWMVILVLFLLGGIISFFIGNDWRGNEVFTDTFGESPTSTYSGGGAGGGGGGSW